MQPILVSGATGTLGRGVVGQLLASGHEARGLSRRPPAGGGEWSRVGDCAHRGGA